MRNSLIYNNKKTPRKGRKIKAIPLLSCLYASPALLFLEQLLPAFVGWSFKFAARNGVECF